MAKRLSPKEKRQKNFKAYLESLRRPDAEELYACCDDAGLVAFVRKITSEDISSLFDIERREVCIFKIFAEDPFNVKTSVITS